MAVHILSGVHYKECATPLAAATMIMTELRQQTTARRVLKLMNTVCICNVYDFIQAHSAKVGD